MKLFCNFNDNSKNYFYILDRILNSEKQIKIIKIPENFEKISRVNSISFEELKKIDLKKLGKVILEFTPKAIFKLSKEIILENLEDIFFNINSEYKFSYCADELTSEEYDKIIIFLKNDRLKLNMEVLNCLRNLLIYSKILEYDLKLSKQDMKMTNGLYSASIKFLNKTIPELKKKNDKYVGEMREYIKEIFEGNKENLFFKIPYFIKKFDLFIFTNGDLIKILLINLFDRYNQADEFEKMYILEEAIFNIQNINERGIIPFLCEEKPNFDKKNFLEKLKKYNFITLFEDKVEIKLEDGITFDIDYSSKEKAMRVFLQSISSTVLKNYLKLFLFCCRDEKIINQEQIKDVFSSYENLENIHSVYEEKNDNFLNFEKIEILFKKKIEFLLIMFKEKIKNIRIVSEANSEYDKLKKISYENLRKEYINNILKMKYNLEIEAKSEIYVFRKKVLKQEKALKKMKKYLEKKKEKEKIEESLYQIIQIIESIPKEKINIKRGRKIEKKNLFQNSYLENIKEFSFSSPLRVEIYYKILLLNILFSIDKKDFREKTETLRNENKNTNSEEKNKNLEKNFQIYYNALMRNDKKLGEKHLKYLIYYLNEKEDEKTFDVINCINFLHIYSENLLENIINLGTFEKYFPFYEEIKLEELIFN